MKMNRRILRLIFVSVITSMLAISCEDDFGPLDAENEGNLTPNNSLAFYKAAGETIPDGYELAESFPFLRGTGKPETVTETFVLEDATEPVIIRLINGPEGFFRSSSAAMFLNGEQFLFEEELNQDVSELEFVLQCGENNSIEAQLNSMPGSAIQVLIFKKKKVFDLIAYFPFNGDARDESNNGWDGSVINAQLTSDREGIEESAYFFNGNASINIGDLDLANPFSISLWLNPTTVSGKQWVISKSGTNNTDNYSMLVNEGSIVFVIKSDILTAPKTYIYSSVSAGIQPGTWTHVACVWDGTYLTLYLNGEYVNQVDADYNSLITNDTPNTSLGNRYQGICCGQTPYYGILDDVIFFEQPLSDSDIQYIHLNGIE